MDRSVLLVLALATVATASPALVETEATATLATMGRQVPGCGKLQFCCAVARVGFVAECPHPGGTCCGSTGFCCPADFTCSNHQGSVSCVKAVAVVPPSTGVAQLPSVVPAADGFPAGAQGQLSHLWKQTSAGLILKPGHRQVEVQKLKDGTVVTTTTRTYGGKGAQRHAKRHMRPRRFRRARVPRAYRGASKRLGGGRRRFRRPKLRVSKKQIKKDIKKAAKLAPRHKPRKPRHMKRDNLPRSAFRRRRRRVEKRGRRRKKQVSTRSVPPLKGKAPMLAKTTKRRAHKVAGGMPPVPKKRTGAKGRGAGKVTKKTLKRALKKAAAKSMNKVNLKDAKAAGVKPGKGLGVAKGPPKPVPVNSCAGGGPCGMHHRVKLNANTEVIIGKPKPGF